MKIIISIYRKKAPHKYYIVHFLDLFSDLDLFFFLCPENYSMLDE